MGKYFCPFAILILLTFVGIGIFGLGEVHAAGGGFDVPQVDDHFNKVEKGSAPKKTEPLNQNVEEGDGFWDWMKEAVSGAWEWTKEAAASFWEWFEGVLELLTSVVVVVGSFLKGIGKAIFDAVAGIWNLITNPIDSVKNVINAIMNPIDTAKAIWKSISESWVRDVVNGDAKSRAEWFGYALGQIGLAIVGTKGADKVSKIIRGSRRKVKEGEDIGDQNNNGSGKGDHDGKVDHAPETVKNLEDQIRYESKEHGQFFDKNGNPISDIVVGNEKSINLKKYKDVAEDAVFTHNHPTNGVFSLPDLQTAVGFNMAEIRAVTPNGTTYSMKRGPDGWKIDPYLIETKFKEAQRELRNDPTAQKLFKEGNHAAVWDMLFQKIAKELGGEYHAYRK
ncbi:hypothetical protein ACFO25_00540 [Paenactinomyces guangxiensis]|uniref:Uncharacterized protein n=1 Tax=Paenactinomyces guangxiensis TaxID=1490290 RepID=A0A7W1WSK6_9BACL|nr:hypothetical protein [Paenactinomyces guangxiensis]MBA4495194.1 hypothetical protein [Paenactinomyces guangxiensis]MBH8592278.1 hypothetical protein [Paenactinomyces guangxiensis]